MNAAQQLTPHTGSESCNAIAGGKRDKRYTVSLEFCGYDEKMHVVRFCKKWVGCSRSRQGANGIIADDLRLRALELEGATRSEAQAFIDAEDRRLF